MSFWGTVISQKNSYIHRDHDHNRRLRITQAALGLRSRDNFSTNEVVVLCTQGKESRLRLCVLIPENVESQSLALELDGKEDVEISVIGSHEVNLSGFFHDGHHHYTFNKEKFDQRAKDISESESKGNDNFEEDDYDYNDSFIVDDRYLKGSRKTQSFKRKSCGEEVVNNKKHEKASNPLMKPTLKSEAVWRKQLTPKFEL